MKTGAVAILDILGFKGIWQRHTDVDQLLSRMDAMQKRLATTEPEDDMARLKENTSAMFGSLWDERNWVPPTVKFISDSIFIAASQFLVLDKLNNKVSPEVLRMANLMAHCLAIGRVNYAVRAVIKEGLATEPKFAYRGCIAYGKYSDQSSFIVGPAVDEAASLERLAEGAIVWLAPSAKAVVEDSSKMKFKQEIVGEVLQLFTSNEWLGVFPTTVPLKEGRQYRTFGIHPFDNAEQHVTESFVQGLLDTFRSRDDRPLDVSIAIKRENTLDYLKDSHDARQVNLQLQSKNANAGSKK